MVYKRGWWCAWCQVPYHRTNVDEAEECWWIPCDFCFRFAHMRCEQENDAKALSKKLYACPECRERKDLLREPMKKIGKVPRGVETKEIVGHVVYRRPFDHNSSEVRALEKRRTQQGTTTTTSRSRNRSLKDAKNIDSVKKLIKKRVAPERRKQKSTRLASLAQAAERSASILTDKKPEEKQSESPSELDGPLYMSLRPRAPKELAKEWADREQHAEAPSATRVPRRSRSGVRKKKSPSLFDTRIELGTQDHVHGGGVLFPWETGGMVGPLSQLGSLMGDVPKPRSSALTSQPRGHRAPSRVSRLPQSKSFDYQPSAAMASQNAAEEAALENIAQGIYKSLDPSFDKYTIHLNVCRLLHELTANHANASSGVICKAGLNDLVRALLTSDDVIIRLSADALLRLPSWREAICVQSPPQRVDSVPLNLPSISTFSGLPSMFTGLPSAEPTPVSHVVTRPIPQRPRCPREAQESRKRAHTLGTSTSSPTETITPSQSQPQASLPLPFFQIPSITSQGADTEAEDALLFSASQDVPARHMS